MNAAPSGIRLKSLGPKLSAETANLREKRTWHETVGRGDRTTSLPKAFGCPGVTGAEGRVGSARAIPSFAQAYWVSGFIQRVGPLDVPAEAGEAALG